MFKRIRAIEKYRVFEDKAEKPKSVTHIRVNIEPTVSAETDCKRIIIVQHIQCVPGGMCQTSGECSLR